MATILPCGVTVKFSFDGLMFNLKDLYMDKYNRYHKATIAMKCFLASPVFCGIQNKLAHQALILKRGNYLHTGLLGFVLLDLRLIREEELGKFNQEMRELVNATILKYYYRKIVPATEIYEDSERFRLANLADKIIGSATADKFVVGGVTALASQPRPWIVIEADSPTHVPMSTTSNVRLVNPLLLDARLVLDGTLNVIYTTLAAVLAKRAALLSHREIAPQAARNDDDQWPLEVQVRFAALLDDD